MRNAAGRESGVGGRGGYGARRLVLVLELELVVER
jgi:hypothetical protein